MAYSTVDRPWLALWRSCQWAPASCQRNELSAVVQGIQFFPSVALGAREESARLSENTAVETWNSLIMTSLCFCFEGFGSGMRSSFQGDNQENLETSASSTKQQEKERIVQHLLLSPLSLCLNFFFKSLFFKTCFGLQQGRSSSCCTSEDSRGPSGSCRRGLASAGAAAWEEDPGSIYRSGWSDRNC